MTQNGNFKRRVRARAAKTGESYSTARMHVSASFESNSSDSPKSLLMAVGQMTIRMDPRDKAAFEASGADIRALMRTAKQAGAKLLHLPEGATCWPDKRILSETGPETIGAADWSRFHWSAQREELEKIRKLAKELGLWVVLGSVHKLTEPQRPHSSLYFISSRGQVVTRYDERLLSYTKVSFMYSPGSQPVTFEIDGLTFGCALGMESHFPEIFTEYERLDVDCVLFSTTGGSAAYPNDAAFTAEVLGHAASNSYWVSYAVPAKPDKAAIAGIVSPLGEWATQCDLDGTPSIAVFEIDDYAGDPARPWRRSARSGIYEPHRVVDDPRSERRDLF